MKRSFSVLDHEVTVTTDRPDWLERLDDIAVRADDPQPIRRTLHLRLRQGPDGILIEHEGQVCAQGEGLDLAIRALHLQINQLVLEPQREVLKLHAAAGTWRGRFFMVTGDRGAGKTTLLLKMMLDGAEMHCDETVLLHDGLLQTFPRKFYVKTGTLKCLPRVAAVCATKRAYPGFFGKQLYFADPTDFGLPWRSRAARPWAVFHLTPAFKKPPVMQPCPKVEMAKQLMMQTVNLAGDLGRHVAHVCRLVGTCRCYSLRVGGLEATAALLKKTLA
jgi:hypothetical protein